METRMKANTTIELEIEVTWIRHGMTSANEQHRYLGREDAPLSEAGIRKLRAGEQKSCGSYLVSSPMKRCIQTAEVLFDREPDLIIPEWREMDFGQFEGKNYRELKDDPRYQSWIDGGGKEAFPDGESREAFLRRSMKGLHHMLTALADDRLHPEKSNPSKLDITAVVHGGTIMAVLSGLTGREYFDFQVKNGGGYRSLLTVGDGQITITEIKEISC